MNSSIEVTTQSSTPKLAKRPSGRYLFSPSKNTKSSFSQSKSKFQKLGSNELYNNVLLNILSDEHENSGQVLYSFFQYQVKQIYELLKNYSFFKLFFKPEQYEEQNIFKLCSKMNLKIFPKGAIVFKEGQPSNDMMYIIIQGRVNVSMKKSIAEFELHEGQFFGEKALIQEKNSYRSATCTAIADLYLVALCRKDFQEVLKEYKKIQQKKKELISKSIPKFSTIISPAVIENLMYRFKEETYHRGNIMTTENQSGEYFYILEEGEIALVKQSMLLCIIDEGVIGEEVLFSDQLHYYTTIVLTEEVKILKVQAGAFKMGAPSFCIEGLKQSFQEKQEFRSQLYNQDKVHYSDEQNYDLNELGKLFICDAYKQLKKEQLRNEFMQHVNKQMGYGPIVTGTEDKCLERIKNSQFKPMIQKLIDGDDDLNDLKSELIQKNMVNQYRMSLKSQGSMIRHNLKSEDDASYFDLYPTYLKKEAQLHMVCKGIIKLKRDDKIKKGNRTKEMEQKINKKKLKFISTSKKFFGTMKSQSINESNYRSTSSENFHRLESKKTCHTRDQQFVFLRKSVKECQMSSAMTSPQGERKNISKRVGSNQNMFRQVIENGINGFDK